MPRMSTLHFSALSQQVGPSAACYSVAIKKLFNNLDKCKLEMGNAFLTMFFAHCFPAGQPCRALLSSKRRSLPTWSGFQLVSLRKESEVAWDQGPAFELFVLTFLIRNATIYSTIRPGACFSGACFSGG